MKRKNKHQKTIKLICANRNWLIKRAQYKYNLQLADAEDMAHNTILNALESLKTIDTDVFEFHAWMKTILKHEVSISKPLSITKPLPISVFLRMTMNT